MPFLPFLGVQKLDSHHLEELKYGYYNPLVSSYSLFILLMLLLFFSSLCCLGVDNEGHQFVCWDVTMHLCVPLAHFKLFCFYGDCVMPKKDARSYIWGSFSHLIRRFTDNPWGEVSEFCFIWSFSFVPCFSTFPYSCTCPWNASFSSSLPMRMRGYKEHAIHLEVRSFDCMFDCSAS